MTLRSYAWFPAAFAAAWVIGNPLARRRGLWWVPSLLLAGYGLLLRVDDAKGLQLRHFLPALVMVVAALHLAAFIRLSCGSAVVRALYLGLSGLASVAALRLAAGAGGFGPALACVSALVLPLVAEEVVRDRDRSFGEATYLTRVGASVAVSVIALVGIR